MVFKMYSTICHQIYYIFSTILSFKLNFKSHSFLAADFGLRDSIRPQHLQPASTSQ